MGLDREQVRVGGLAIEVAEAVAAAQRYIWAEDGGAYGFPAYDAMVTGSAANELNDGDLLAPMLLNAAPSLRGFYSLQEHRSRWEQGLAPLPLDVDLEDADDGLVAAVARLYAPLGNGGLPGVRGTVLAKVLHRKRPRLVPLFDSQLLYAYQEAPGAPVPADPLRTWPEFMLLFARAVRDDMRSAAAARLIDAVTDLDQQGRLTRLRAWDIVAWQAVMAHLKPARDAAP